MDSEILDWLVLIGVFGIPLVFLYIFMKLYFYFKYDFLRPKNKVPKKKTKKRKDPFDVENYLKGIIKIGGQAIAKVPMKKFVDYVHVHGEQLPSQAGTVHGLVKIDNKMYKVEFSSGVFHNLNDGETLIVITKK